MKDPKQSIYFHCPNRQAVSFAMKEECPNLGQITRPLRLSFSTGLDAKPENVSFPSTRCSEKGCVFPASSQGSGKCSYHLHQQEEPALFHSHQPTGLLLDPARSLPTERENSGSRKRDRRRMAAIWEQFQSEGTS
jgi:hypothetical protein